MELGADQGLYTIEPSSDGSSVADRRCLVNSCNPNGADGAVGLQGAFHEVDDVADDRSDKDDARRFTEGMDLDVAALAQRRLR